MRILLTHKADLSFSPPVISSLLILSDLGHELHLMTEGLTPYWSEELNRRGISVHVVPNRWRGKFGLLGKFLAYRNFKHEFYRLCSTLFPRGDEGLVWVEGAYTIVALGTRLQRHRYILQIQELHENSRMQLRAIGRVIHDAECVFMPEYNRGVLYQCWYKLKRRPVVLPNKPYFILSNAQLEQLREKYRDLLEVFLREKVILYQGHIHSERDISPFVRAIDKMPGYRLVLLGRDHGMLKDYQAISSKIIHIDFIPAPDYLVFTSLCHIGIVCYAADTLNTAYCAPNKIYEYSAFGRPMLGNDIPGLKIVEQQGAGVLVDETNMDEIVQAIQKISNEYERYSEDALRFFSSQDNQKIITEVINRITNKK